ncbi:pentatricopeptide repeat-containing protein At1g12775, mitochondrial-like [Gossypium hirsutum]|uniref:Pentatricopeptide repeat-containing protein At1g12775, mitochondrial-like n=1 Tax=Gossypium hirsutum TaxID=3635 RepID=A0ABM2YXD4_GOSHI|nr:pentatricopeptide repeat-containing protein At1g12775, mitochondrial-like [Gossypium hirsutum]
MDRAIEVLELMTGDNVRYPFDNFVCSSVIVGFCKIGKPEVVVRFFENCMNSGALKPNVVTYTALLSSFNLLGKFDEGCELVYSMKKEGLALDAILYSCWILGYFRNGCLMEALRKYREMVERGINPDTVSYTVLIDGFSKEGSVGKVVGFLKKMLKDGVMPNVITYTAIMLGFCKEGKFEKAFRLFKEVQTAADGHSTENCLAFKRRVQGLIDAGILRFDGTSGTAENPFPNHTEGNVSAVGEEDKRQSRRWVTEIKTPLPRIWRY